jgi:hypothetical protein
LVAVCLGQVAVVPEGLPVDEEPLPELVPPVLPVPLLPPALVPFVVPPLVGLPLELVVPVDPGDELSEGLEPLVDEPLVDEPLVSPPLWGVEPLEGVVEPVLVDDVPDPEGSEPPFNVAVTDDPGSVRPVDELSDELEVAGVVVVVGRDEPRAGSSEPCLDFRFAAWGAELAFDVTSAVPAAVAAAACALEI